MSLAGAAVEGPVTRGCAVSSAAYAMGKATVFLRPTAAPVGSPRAPPEAVSPRLGRSGGTLPSLSADGATRIHGGLSSKDPPLASIAVKGGGSTVAGGLGTCA